MTFDSAKGGRMGAIRLIVSAAGAAWRFARGHVVLCVSALCALAGAAAVPPDASYVGYFDVRTLVCLFSILAVVQALRAAGAFERAACALVTRFQAPRAAVVALVGATTALSMVATNDMALVMMLPLAAATLVRAGWTRLVPLVFTLQSLGANLGGMIVPFGNPQNLYLFSYFDMSVGAFVGVMALPFAVSMALVFAVAMLAPLGDLDARAGFDGRSASGGPAEPRGADGVSRGRTIVCLALLGLVIAAVFDAIPPVIVLVVVVAVLAVADRSALRRVDYALLLTFCCFFVFSGNLARVPVVSDFFGSLMESWGLVVSAGLSQVVSNVPAAVLLSHFTDAWQPLLVGVNIGGAGTVVGSLASLITLQHFLSMRKLPSFRAAAGMDAGRFLVVFMGLNMVFFIVLLLVCSLAC